MEMEYSHRQRLTAEWENRFFDSTNWSRYSWKRKWNVYYYCYAKRAASGIIIFSLSHLNGDKSFVISHCHFTKPFVASSFWFRLKSFHGGNSIISTFPVDLSQHNTHSHDDWKFVINFVFWENENRTLRRYTVLFIGQWLRPTVPSVSCSKFPTLIEEECRMRKMHKKCACGLNPIWRVSTTTTCNLLRLRIHFSVSNWALFDICNSPHAIVRDMPSKMLIEWSHATSTALSLKGRKREYSISDVEIEY